MAFITASGRTQTSLADINITPLVDVVLVLLVIFMITAPVLQSGIEVNVPKTRTVREITQQRVVLTIAKDGSLYLDDKPINVHDLGARLHSSDPSKQIIYVRADERLPFGLFANVMESVTHAGVTNISIITQPLETKTGPGAQ